MCRITGFWDLNYDHSYSLEERLLAMRDSLQHGGPDSAGKYIDTQNALALGHRRLSILDLTAAGHQPMFWKEWVIVFNGEVYNFMEIRQSLEKKGFSFETKTDTEVILKAFKAWGKEMVTRFRGFFAFAIFNTTTQKLTLCRDRVGVKPLFWYWKDGLFMFASELKAFHEHPKFDKTISIEAVSLYLQQGYIQYPYCIFEYAHKLPAGAYLELTPKQSPQIEKYWDVQAVYANTKISTKTEAELEEELEAILTDSFELRMVADVPVGAFLSGGIDSSLVTALLQKKEGRQLKTFTIGFHDKEYNEAQHAKAVAQHLGTDHHEFYCTEQDFEQVIPLLPDMYDEPFGDSSGIPTYLVSKMAREQVTVSLSADGGDEIFGGYTKYEITQNFYPKIKKIPSFMRSMLGKMSAGIDPLWLERNSSKIPILKNYKNISNKYPKLVNALGAKDQLDFFNISSTYIAQKDLLRLLPTYRKRYETRQIIEQDRLISYLGMVDIDTYLEGDIMTKVDRATMAVALEGRDPFLDHKIIEFAMQLPDSLKIRGVDTKYLLRKILYKYVPKNLIERPKQGFSIPVQKWLMNHLKEQLLVLKNDQDFLDSFHLEQKEINQIIDNFIHQQAYINPHFIWFLYTLHQWYYRWIKK
ncbi:asparagine synthase (glutamine-hydrolyzing) [Aureispira anguillae]|uniref:asparagine synthase (glutamine-hydrolyzing) n=1 Tax=Aureispira anguillae TaxID=2864201 RepID=A0A916DVB7_9BACT|nr:asparagine synthase (glutamine-hydrolyzing) [Aureispira anguillae]BDS14979.1 asparagine synthase (glutamine-hydrolyzing) [Aureispira anguillae]